MFDEDAGEQNHWSERGRATSVGNTNALGRPRRSVLSFGGMSSETKQVLKMGALFAFFSSHSFAASLDWFQSSAAQLSRRFVALVTESSHTASASFSRDWVPP